jgi:hypothetical protein
MRTVSEKGRAENQNTHFMFNNASPKTRAIYEILWKNTVEPEATDDAIWRMCIACWITTATDTQNMLYLLLFQGKSSYSNAPQCYIYKHIAFPD